MPSLIESIYEAVVQPDGWETVARSIASAFSANNVAITGYNYETGFTDATDICKDSHYLDSFANYWAKRNFLWDATVRLPVGSTFQFETILPREDLNRIPIYNEWFRPQKLEAVLGTHLLTEGPWSITATLYRAASQPEFDADAIARFTALLPHLQRAAQLRARLARAELHRADIRSALDILDRPAILVDRDSRVTFANRAADRLVNDKVLFISMDRHLSVFHPVQSRKLHRIIAECLADGAGSAGGSLAIYRPNGRPLTAIISQLPPSRSIFALPTALLMIDDPERVSSRFPRLDLLREEYGLTNAEARLAIALLHGQRLRDIADEFGVTFSTARTHLARIFQKTLVNSQADLVRLLVKAGFDR